MATPIWIGAAADLAGVWTITVANTWAANDTVTVTVGNRDLTVTTDSAVVADIATQIGNALTANRRDENLQGAETRTAGGREYGEFWDLDKVTVSGAVVTITGKPGKAITIAVTESTAGTGTATLAAVQTPTGMHFWDNIDNWSTGAVPVNGDTVVFSDSDVHCLYGFPNGSLQPASVDVRASFTGRLGLPRINRDVPQMPYPEYRQLRPVLDDDAASTTTIVVGSGAGPGSPLINLEQSAGLASVTVIKTGVPQPLASGYAFNFVGASGDAATYTVLDGSVSIAEGSDEAANVGALMKVGEGPNSSPQVLVGAGVTITSGIEVYSGSVLANSGFTSYYALGGALTIDTADTTAYTALVAEGGGVARLVRIGDMTTNNAAIYNRGTIDMRALVKDITIPGVSIYQGGTLIDPIGGRVTYTNGITPIFATPNDVSLDLPQGVTITLP